MINEAVFALEERVATREGIDTVMKLGMNHPIGPLALADLIGLDVCLDILVVLHRGFGDDKYRPSPLLRAMVAALDLARESVVVVFSDSLFFAALCFLAALFPEIHDAVLRARTAGA